LTFEEIAKYKFPEALTPEKLKKAIDSIKKQFCAAKKLILGNDYDPEKSKIILSELRPLQLCDTCSDKRCERNGGDLCPSMIEYLESIEGKRTEALANIVEKDLDEYNK